MMQSAWQLVYGQFGTAAAIAFFYAVIIAAVLTAVYVKRKEG